MKYAGIYKIATLIFPPLSKCLISFKILTKGLKNLHKKWYLMQKICALAIALHFSISSQRSQIS